MQPTLNSYQSTFYWVVARVYACCTPLDTSYSSMAPVRSPIVAGVTLQVDVIGWWVVQLFIMQNLWHFLYLPLESRESNISCTPITTRATLSTTSNRKGQQIQYFWSVKSGKRLIDQRTWRIN
jgi:hypothetical protein